MSVYFHKDVAERFVATMLRSYRGHCGLFASVHHELPGASVQRRFAPVGVKLGSRKHALWLTIVNSFDTMSESYQVHGAVWRRFLQPSLFSGYNKVEWLFDRRVLSLTKQELTDIFRQIGVSFANRRAELFYRFVRDLYGPVLKGDPRNIYKVLGSSISEINRYQTRHRPKFMSGYAEKLLSLLAIYFYEFGIHDEMFPGAYPADRHVQRQLIQSGVVTFDSSETEVDAAHVIAELIRLELIPVIKELGGTALEFSHAQWFLGNRLCRQCNNDIKQGDTALIRHFCPLWVRGDLAGGLCIGGRSTADYHRSGKWRTSTSIFAPASQNSQQHELFVIESEA